MPRLLHEITPFDGQYHYHNVTLVQNVNQGIQCIFERGWGKGIFIFYNLKMKFKRSSKNVSSCRNKVRDMLKNFHLSQCRYCDRVMLIMLIIWCFLDLLLDLAVNFVLKKIHFILSVWDFCLHCAHAPYASWYPGSSEGWILWTGVMDGLNHHVSPGNGTLSSLEKHPMLLTSSHCFSSRHQGQKETAWKL